MTVILLKAWANDEWAHLQPDHAVVQIDFDYARYLLARMDLARQIEQSHGDLYCIEFHDGAATWYECDDALWDLCDDGYATISDDDLPKGLGRVPAECQTLRVSDRDLHWVAYVEDSKVEMETACIDRDLIEKIARREA